MLANRLNHGFTLIEVLVALAIFALIGVASVSVVTNVANAQRETERSLEALQQLQMAMLTVERDFRQAIPRAMNLDRDTGQLVILGGEGEYESQRHGIGFVRNGNINPGFMLPRSTLQPVIYLVEDGVLIRRHLNFVDSISGTEPKQRSLLSGIMEFDIEYLPPTTPGAMTLQTRIATSARSSSMEWVESYRGQALPRAFKVMIVHEQFGRVERIFQSTDGHFVEREAPPSGATGTEDDASQQSREPQ